jgi:twinkle protein
MSREHGWMVGNIFLEEKSVKSQQRYIAYDNSVSLNKYRQDFDNIPKESRLKTKKELVDNMMFLDHSGSIDVDVLMNKIRYMVNKGCKLVVLDHLSLVVTGSDDERAQLDDLMEKVYRYVENTPVHIISVVHLNRGDGKKDPSKGAEITPNFIRSSGGVMQMAFNLGCMEGWVQHPKHKNKRFIRWLKIRETGEVGLTRGCLEYDPETGKFTYNSDISKEDVEDEIREESKQDFTPSMSGKFNNKAV